MTLLAGILDVIQPLIVSIASITGAAVAVLGLQTWQRQLKGHTEYELARRLLRAVFTLRDGIANVRHPFMSAGELHEAAVEAGLDPDPLGPEWERVSQAARAKRWRAVQDASSALRLEELEAEVLWGPAVAKCTNDLRARIGEVWVAEIEYQDRKGDDADNQDRERIVELRHIMYGSGSERDETASRINQAVESVEAVIRPKLKPGQEHGSKAVALLTRRGRDHDAGRS